LMKVKKNYYKTLWQIKKKGLIHTINA